MSLFNSYKSAPKIISKRTNILFHVFFIILVLVYDSASWDYQAINYLQAYAHLIYLSIYFFSIYFNVFYLFPKLFFKKSKWVYFTIYLFFVFVMHDIANFITFTSDMVEMYTHLSHHIISYLVMRFGFLANHITISSLLILFNLYRNWVTAQEEIHQLETEVLQGKLKQLRAQINPHFLFNTFNNLYSISLYNHKILPKMILGLSDLMYYQLHESTKEKVLLSKEIDYINNLFLIEKLRKENLDFAFNIEPAVFSDKYIEPLIFIALVENAIKHSMNKLENPIIHINLVVREKDLSFVIENNFLPLEDINTAYNGVGLNNLKKRLELIYPNNSELIIHQNLDLFKVELKILNL
jgi:two-component system LytT family sensor kinase